MSCPNKITVKAYLSPEEYKIVTDLAVQARLSVSKLVRAACLGLEIKSTADQEAVLALLKLKADLGRLGGLLKQALGAELIDRRRGHELFESLNKTQRILLEKAKAL
jgi:hypothetical protein